MIRIDHSDTTICVTSPYLLAFVERARALGGRWDAARRAWAFDEAGEDAVRHALTECYGTDGDGDTVALYLYYVEDDSVRRKPVSLGALTIARAFGRDSGARLGDGVAHLAGPKPISAGSVKNWGTRIPAGCLLVVYGVPRAVAERAIERGGTVVVAEIGTDTESREAVLGRLRVRAGLVTLGVEG